MVGLVKKIASFYGNQSIKVLNFGAAKEFNDEVPIDKLYERYHLVPEKAAEKILETLKF